MKTVIIASHNPVKIAAARAGFTRMFGEEAFTFQPVAAPSGVSDQPKTNEETLVGALNRSENARTAHPEADYWVGIEGGIEDSGADGMWAFAWVVVRTKEQVGRSRTALLALPWQVAELVREGKELGEADDIVFGKVNSKQQDGAVGLLTGGVIDRAAFYTQAVILALVPFKNGELYS